MKHEVKALESLKVKNSYLTKKSEQVLDQLSVQERLSCSSNIILAANNQEKSKISKKCQPLKELIDEIDQYLKRLGEESSNIKTVEDYQWICETAMSWERELSNSFYTARTVNILKAPHNLLPPLDPGDALSEEELERHMHGLIKLVRAYRILKGEQDDRIQTLAGLDRQRAEIFLANDILNGTINFARRISSDSYWRLEKVWMAEIRELLAYLEWEASGAELFGPNTERHYYKAWDDFANRIKAFDFKVTANEFGEAKRYLEKNYVTLQGNNYKLKADLDKDKSSILHIKSQKIWKEMGRWYPDRYWDNQQNWLDAKKYVSQYYENIIPAIVDEDEKCAEAVINAFDFSMKGPYRIINAFEMVLVVYFFSSKILKKINFPA